MKLKFKKLHPKAVTPSQATVGSVGFDLESINEVYLYPRTTSLINTGIALELPPNMEAQIRSRSGMAYKDKIFVLNSPGTIDSDYRGEIKIILYNPTDKLYIVKEGDSVAQLVFQKREFIELEEVEMIEETLRGEQGFGSTKR